jgi:hypothetical protein
VSEEQNWGEESDVLREPCNVTIRDASAALMRSGEQDAKRASRLLPMKGVRVEQDS